MISQSAQFTFIPLKTVDFPTKTSKARAKCHNTSKRTIVHIGILGIPEKSELLLIATAKLLQKHGLLGQVS